VATIECSVPEELLTKREGVIDNPARYGRFVQWYLGDVSVGRYEQTIFDKVSPFDSPTCGGLVDENGEVLIEIGGARMKSNVDLLSKQIVICYDNESEFSTAIEFRIKTGEVVHRSAETRKKLPLDAIGVQMGKIG